MGVIVRMTTMRRIATTAALTLALVSIPVLVSVGSTAQAQVACKATKAKPHDPKVVTPPKKISSQLPKTMTLVTNCGNIAITTVGVKAQITLTALSTLARGGYFDLSLCHRLTTDIIFVLQCGDPTATGGGGPAWSPYPDENLPQQVTNNYPAGTVAMANSGPNTNGSQFFLVYGDTTLGASYTIWGTITAGLDIVKAIAAGGVKAGGRSPGDGTPKKTIAIEKVLLK